MRDEFANWLLKRAEGDPRIIFITADLGFGVFETFKSNFPKQYLNVGVSEQNMITVATGLAMSNHICFVYSIGNFPIFRCLEQIRNDALYHEANVKVISVGGGFSYGNLGYSHHATEDVAIMRALPGISVFTPGTLSEVRASLEAAYSSTGVSYVRLDKSWAEEDSSRCTFEEGRWSILKTGDDVTIIAMGGIIQEALIASELLSMRDISVQIVSANQMSNLRSEDFEKALGDANLVVTVEEHTTQSALSGIVAEQLINSNRRRFIINMGAGQKIVSLVGSQTYIRKQLQIDGRSIAERIFTFLSL